MYEQPNQNDNIPTTQVPPVAPPPTYTPPAPQPAPYRKPQSNGLGIAAMVVGICSLFLGWIPFFGVIMGAVAVTLGIIGLKKHSAPGMSIAGIVTGGVSTLWSLAMTALFLTSVALLGGVASQAGNAITTYNTEQQTKIDAKKDFEKGATAIFDAYEVKANSVQRNYVAVGEYSAASAGNEFVLVNVTVKNASSSSESFTKYDLKLSSDGVAVPSSYVVVAPDFTGGSLSAGASTTGNIVFEMPKSATNLELQYELPVYSTSSPSVNSVTYTLKV